jgi:hypothetical protein
LYFNKNILQASKGNLLYDLQVTEHLLSGPKTQAVREDRIKLQNDLLYNLYFSPEGLG